MNLTIDTYAWVEVSRDSPRGRIARSAMDAAEACITPAVVLAELACTFVRDGFSDDLIVRVLETIREASDVAPIDPSIALGAARALTELRDSARARKLSLPGLGDALILATARHARSSLLTGDPHFRELPETVWIG